MSEQAIPPQTLRLLIVEDSEDDALLLLHRFRSAGYTVQYRRVDNALDMRIALQAQAWDAVLSDHRMPAFNANAALTLMQSLDYDLPFIIVSGVIDEETAIAAMRAGAHDYLSKDKLDRLVPAVERERREASNRAERRSALEAVHESEARYRTLATNLPGMVFQLRLEGDLPLLTYASEGCMLLLAQQPEQVCADASLFTNMIEAEDRAGLEAALMRSRRDNSTVNWDGRIRFASGEIKWINMRAAPRQDAVGERLWEGIMSNVTHSKRTEGELRESREQLRELQLHLERVREEERERIARDIHDVLGGNLVAIKIEASLLEAKLESDPQALRATGPLDRPVDRRCDCHFRTGRTRAATGNSQGIRIACRHRMPGRRFLPTHRTALPLRRDGLRCASQRGCVDRDVPRVPGSADEHRQARQGQPHRGQHVAGSAARCC